MVHTVNKYGNVTILSGKAKQQVIKSTRNNKIVAGSMRKDFTKQMRPLKKN